VTKKELIKALAGFPDDTEITVAYTYENNTMTRTELEHTIFETKRALWDKQDYCRTLRREHSKAKHGDGVGQAELWKELKLQESVVAGLRDELEGLRVRWTIGHFEEDAGGVVVRYKGKCWFLPDQPERDPRTDRVKLLDLEGDKRGMWAPENELRRVVAPKEETKAEQLAFAF